MIKRLTNFLLDSFRIIIFLLLIYTVVATIGALIPTHPSYQSNTNGTSIFVKQNKRQIVFILPANKGNFNWPTRLGLKAKGQFVSFELGDRSFMQGQLDSNFISPLITLNALLIPSKTAMRITFYEQAPAIAKNCFELKLNEEQYEKLGRYISGWINRDVQSQLTNLTANEDPTSQQHLFAANSQFFFLFTGNNWVNSGLKSIGIRNPKWAPFGKGIFYQLKKMPAQ